jgi:glycosyltransferase involved in cell wall biosynthesis
MKVIISNGHFKFILGTVAAELHKRGLLKLFITAGYPSPIVAFLVRTFAGASKGGARLLDRKENVPNSLVCTMWLSEFIQKLAGLLFSVGSSNNYILYGFSLTLYSWKAIKVIKQTNAEIYHYRAGYGRGSVAEAKRKGMITICDHSLAHPRVLHYMIENGGQFPALEFVPAITRFWADVEDDINQADFVIVNSDFVKDTFLNRGWDARRVFVAYTGLDDALVNNKPARSVSIEDAECIRFQFAGEGGPRKGLPDLLRAFQGINDLPWSLSIVGDIHQSVLDEFSQFLKDSRIKLIPFCSRNELLNTMGQADVFVFPSLAEGSARVVFMAMAMGCFVITTENSGSVVSDGINGTIVKPGNLAELKDAIRNTFAHKDQLKLIGLANSEVIEKKFTQSNYGARIVHIYEEIIACKSTQG